MTAALPNLFASAGLDFWFIENDRVVRACEDCSNGTCGACKHGLVDSGFAAPTTLRDVMALYLELREADVCAWKKYDFAAMREHLNADAHHQRVLRIYDALVDRDDRRFAKAA